MKERLAKTKLNPGLFCARCDDDEVQNTRGKSGETFSATSSPSDFVVATAPGLHICTVYVSAQSQDKVQKGFHCSLKIFNKRKKSS